MKDNIEILVESLYLTSGNRLLAERDFCLVESLINAMCAHGDKGCSKGVCGHLVGAFYDLYDQSVSDLVQSTEDHGPGMYGWFLTKLLSSDHPFLSACQRRRPQDVSSALKNTFVRQLGVVEIWAHTDWIDTINQLCPRSLKFTRDLLFAENEMRETPRSKSLDKLLVRLREKPWSDSVINLGDYIYQYGLPPFREVTAFSIDVNSPRILKPIPSFDSFELSWIEGNDDRLKTIIDNTERFLAGLPAQNVLVWGPRGGGKSSLIRGLVSKYQSRRLRAVEITSADYGYINRIYSSIRETGERFIGVLDNISLNRGDDKVRDLSRAMEGGLEKPPENLLFYATSNFKDLVDREGALGQGLGLMQMEENTNTQIPQSVRPSVYDPQQNQRIDELRALDDRFALKVFIDLPTKSMYQSMVRSYAKRFGVVSDEILFSEFNKWRMRHNHDLIGGRTVRDFIHYYIGCQSMPKERE
ncbi:MAG: DUF815 domain-containing protein [Candidatus Latescibacterota bacterium]|nr:DUF815 domain-containing protein [Candidatus Latescibacterota bacterium]